MGFIGAVAMFLDFTSGVNREGRLDLDEDGENVTMSVENQ